MDRLKPVRQIMTREVRSVQVDARPSDVRHLLQDAPFHHLPVLRGERLVGLLSLADLLPVTLERFVTDARTVDAWLDAQFNLQQLMSFDPETVHPEDPITRAAELLAEGQYHAVPVVEGDEGRLVGIVTSTDIIRYFLTL